MAFTDKDICNLALSKLGQYPLITSLDNVDKNSVLCKQMYGPARDAVLRTHPFNCAVKKADLGSANVPPVECYFDDAVYNQGTYAIRVIVKAAASVANFLRHSYSSDLDISGLDSIKIDLRSTFVGTTAVHFKFHSKLSGDWTSQTETISVENTWETKTFDISSIAQNLREDVDRLEITFEDKASDYMVYIDNMFATSGVAGDEVELDYMEYSSNASAQSAYVSEFSLLLFGWSYMFDLPSSPYCLRVLQVNEAKSKYRLEKRKILTNTATVQLEFVEQVADPTDFDAMLYDLIAIRLASALAISITASTTKAGALLKLYDYFLGDTRRVDANEQTPKELDDDGSWINSRK